MEILIVGKSGYGKSNMGDLVRNTIFKMDEDAVITSHDPDRSVKVLGHGQNIYNVKVKQLGPEDNLASLTPEEASSADVIISVTNEKFLEWFRSIYS